MNNYADIEPLIKAWLTQSTVAALVTRPDGKISIYNAMPAASPVPSVVARRVGGGPRARKDLPEERTRISFDTWGTSRAQASAIAGALLSELEDLGRVGGWTSGATMLRVAEILTHFWMPDPDTDTPRYIIDALVVTTTTT